MPHQGDISAKVLMNHQELQIEFLQDTQDVWESHRSPCMGDRRCGGFWREVVSEDPEPLGHRNCDFIYCCLAHDKCSVFVTSERDCYKIPGGMLRVVAMRRVGWGPIGKTFRKEHG